MSPELCGRGLAISSSNVVLRDGVLIRTDAGLEVPALITEDMLLLTECPRIVENEPSVSDEIVDNGRMYSTLSANPTRTLGTAP